MVEPRFRIHLVRARIVEGRPRQLSRRNRGQQISFGTEQCGRFAGQFRGHCSRDVWLPSCRNHWFANAGTVRRHRGRVFCTHRPYPTSKFAGSLDQSHSASQSRTQLAPVDFELVRPQVKREANRSTMEAPRRPIASWLHRRQKHFCPRGRLRPIAFPLPQC